MGIVTTVITSFTSVYFYKKVCLNPKFIPLKTKFSDIYQTSEFRKHNFPTVLESKEFLNTLETKGYRYSDLSRDLKTKYDRARETIEENSKITKI